MLACRKPEISFTLEWLTYERGVLTVRPFSPLLEIRQVFASSLIAWGIVAGYAIVRVERQGASGMSSGASRRPSCFRPLSRDGSRGRGEPTVRVARLSPLSG